MKTETIYGLHAVRHALEHHPESVLEVWLQKGRKPTPLLEQITARARRHAIEPEHLPRETLDRHTRDAVHQGVVLIRRPPPAADGQSLDALLARVRTGTALFLVLEGLQDPHNLGACLRTADAAGVDAVIIPKDRAVTVNATVRKVASGAAEHTPVIAVTNLARGLRQLKAAGIWLVGAHGRAEQGLYEVDLGVPLALVMGAEGRGLRQNTRKHCDHLIHLPMLGRVESLNVAVAAGICLYEALRQRTS